MKEEIRRLVEEAESIAAPATKGPWIAAPIGLASLYSSTTMIGQINNHYDRRFAAFARSAVPTLCAAIREMDREIEAARVDGSRVAEEAREMNRAAGDQRRADNAEIMNLRARIDELTAEREKERVKWTSLCGVLLYWQDLAKNGPSDALTSVRSSVDECLRHLTEMGVPVHLIAALAPIDRP